MTLAVMGWRWRDAEIPENEEPVTIAICANEDVATLCLVSAVSHGHWISVYITGVEEPDEEAR